MNLLRHSGAALLGALALPAGALALALQPAWRAGLPQRLGQRAKGPEGGIWLHGASVGEAAIMARLCPGLEEMGYPVRASLSTLTGRRRFVELAAGVDCALAPLDHPWVVDRVLSALNPVALVLVETELWPFLISGASRRQVSIAVVSGRLSDRSFDHYRRLRAFFAGRLKQIDRIGARSELDAERFVALGARPERVEVTGDLKLEPLSASLSVAPELDTLLGSCALLVAGSTHDGEDEAALGALRACEREGLEVALVLAPRHMNRVNQVVESVRHAGRSLRLRSQTPVTPLLAGEVLVLDTLGELPACYARAKGAFVGGTLSPKGGHNLVEPAQLGVPVSFGPHIENVRQSAELLQTCGAGRLVRDAQALGIWAVEVFSHRGTNAGAEAGRQLIASGRGSLQRSLSLVSSVVEGRGA